MGPDHFTQGQCLLVSHRQITSPVRYPHLQTLAVRITCSPNLEILSPGHMAACQIPHRVLAEKSGLELLSYHELWDIDGKVRYECDTEVDTKTRSGRRISLSTSRTGILRLMRAWEHPNEWTLCSPTKVGCRSGRRLNRVWLVHIVETRLKSMF